MEERFEAIVAGQPHLSSLLGGLTRLVKVRLPIALIEEARNRASGALSDEETIEAALLHYVAERDS